MTTPDASDTVDVDAVIWAEERTIAAIETARLTDDHPRPAMTVDDMRAAKAAACMAEAARFADVLAAPTTWRHDGRRIA